MQSTVSTPTLADMANKRDRSGSLWLVQAFSGLLLVLILGLHMVAHHFVVEGGLRNYQQVLDYVANPAIFVTEIAFVILAISHGLLGVRAILFDLRPSPGARSAINWGVAIIGVGTIIYGVWLAIALQQLAA